MDDANAAPFFRVLRGSPDEVEIAALVVALLAVSRAGAATGGQARRISRWRPENDYHAPGAWTSGRRD
ncbi:acyl-CoA carboxylase epsilon subunit [Sphaerisporangium dianthi]|uniref:Acyl-CoA carboxylase epsilon subunit n=1 Tax=Sphaerisporangium dianthi TaxID=1436120 RepID=A0ABV9CK01_9ACTN